MKLIMTLGLPASGKSTWAKKMVLDSGGNIKRVNKDDMRDMIDAGKWGKNNEKSILLLRDEIIKHYLYAGFSVIVDDTNLHPKHEATLKALAQRHGAEFETKSFLDVPLTECIKRDLSRPNSVGERVIRGMFDQFLKPEPEAYSPPTGKPKAILCDVDGTLAHMLPQDKGGRGPYEWDKVGTDELDPIVAGILQHYWPEDIMDDTLEPRIILLSGRDSVCRGLTQDWLHRHGIRYHALFMRPEGDMRKDFVVKREIFDQEIRDNYDVLFVLDDRDQVVEMWRSLGLKCLQVAEGKF